MIFEKEKSVSKICNVCNISKSLDQYYIHTYKKKPFNWCKTCDNARTMRYRKSLNPAEYQKRRRVQRNWEMKKRYGITIDYFEQMLLSQDNKCKICKDDLLEIKYKNSKGIHIDHNHKNGRVRAILCTHCNTMLGHSKEDPEILFEAITYLEHYNFLGNA